MIRAALRIVIALLLVAMGWMAAKAQTAAPDFEFVVNAPAGETSIQCVRGCGLAWVGRGVITNSQTTQTFTFKCGGASDPADNRGPRCTSGQVGGWVKP